MKVSVSGGDDGRATPLKKLLEQSGVEVFGQGKQGNCDCDLLICLGTGEELRGRCGILLLPGDVRPPQGVEARCAVSCGFSDRDTLTISGLRDGRAALSLQRELVNLRGVVVEPGEFVVRTTPWDAQLLLTAAAALLALGVPPEETVQRLEKMEC